MEAKEEQKDDDWLEPDPENPLFVELQKAQNTLIETFVLNNISPTNANIVMFNILARGFINAEDEALDDFCNKFKLAIRRLKKC